MSGGARPEGTFGIHLTKIAAGFQPGFEDRLAVIVGVAIALAGRMAVESKGGKFSDSSTVRHQGGVSLDNAFALIEGHQLFRAESLHRIYRCGAPGRDDTGEKSTGCECKNGAA